MKVLVTGAAGFVGSHLVEHLLAQGHEVLGLDSFVPYYDRSVKEANLADARRDPAFRLVEADLRTADLDPLLEGVDAVVHEAAMAGLPLSFAEPDLYMSCNLTATIRLVEAAHRARIGRFLHISTSSVYGLNAVGDEREPTRPVSPYGATKLAAEHVVLAYVTAHGLPASILRYFSVFGPRQRPDMAYHRFAEAMLDARPITVFGDGEQSRSNTYVGDCVRGTALALERAVPGEVYNLCGGEVITLNEAIRELALATGADPVVVERQPARQGDQRCTQGDARKAREALGWEPLVGAREGLRLQAEWHRSRREVRVAA